MAQDLIVSERANEALKDPSVSAKVLLVPAWTGRELPVALIVNASCPDETSANALCLRPEASLIVANDKSSSARYRHGTHT